MKLWKTFFILFFIFSVVGMLWIYWLPFEDIELSSTPKTYNFSSGVNESQKFQFYNNMRYSNSKISYRIDDACTIKKKEDARRAFDILGEQTVLDFYSVGSNEEIFLTCEDKQKIKEDFFIAGEGGPVNITRAGNFNVIHYGEVILIRGSECPNPNVAMHEIFHALGFDHSLNENNIMYGVSKCSQTIGEDIKNLLSELYAFESLPDLIIEGVDPNIHGKYLDFNLSVRNNGLKKSGKAFLNIYSDQVLLEEIELDPLEIGFGVKYSLKNVKIKNSDFENLLFVIESDFKELDKKNNELAFESLRD